MDIVRAAIYFNNAGVSFLLRGEYESSAETLQVALRTIQSVIQNQPCDRTELQQIIDVTSRRLASLTRKEQQQAHISMKAISLDSNINFHQLEEQVTSQFRPIQISDLDNDNLCKAIDEVIPAVILMNYALSYMCLSKIQDDDGDLFDAALKFLDMAMKLLRLHGQINTDLLNDRSSESHLLVAVTIMTNVCCLQQQEDGICPEFFVIMKQQLNTLKSLANEAFFSYDTACVAAAAA